MFLTVPLVALSTMFSKVLSMMFSTAFLLSSLQLSLGYLLGETYIVRMTINIYSILHYNSFQKHTLSFKCL